MDERYCCLVWTAYSPAALWGWQKSNVPLGEKDTLARLTSASAL